MVAVATCRSAAAIAGAFSLRLSVVRPLVAVCNSPNAVFTCCTLGWRTGDADASALSRFALTLAIAVVRAATPSCVGLTCVSAVSEDLSAATSAHAVVDGEAVVSVAVVGAAAVAVGPAWLGAELVPQLVKMHSKETAATVPKKDRRPG